MTIRNATTLGLAAALALGVSLPSLGEVFTLSGPMDVQQAGTNGGFGSGTGIGTGTISGTYDDTTNLLNYSISWQDLTSPVTNAHFHLGAPGVSGGVSLGIPGPWTSPEIGTDIPLNPTQEAQLLAGDWYVNIHTQNFGAGEIRGQVIVTPEPSSLALLGFAGLLAARRRRR